MRIIFASSAFDFQPNYFNDSKEKKEYLLKEKIFEPPPSRKLLIFCNRQVWVYIYQWKEKYVRESPFNIFGQWNWITMINQLSSDQVFTLYFYFHSTYNTSYAIIFIFILGFYLSIFHKPLILHSSTRTYYI